jgi:L-ornithine N5-oxygenase
MKGGGPGPSVDVLGVGLGPANLAVGAALFEHAPDLNWRIAECEPAFAWHPGMMLTHSRMQHSFLKDLATLRDPRSAFTFLQYLHEMDRLADFVELRSFAPVRVEYADYLAWAAGKLAGRIDYGTRVTQITPQIGADGCVRDFVVHTSGSRAAPSPRYIARNVILGLGGRPSLPAAAGQLDLNEGDGCHTADLRSFLDNHLPDKTGAHRFAVVGAGQSAIEATLHLLSAYSNADVAIISRGHLFKSVEENAYVNRLFSQDGADQFFGFEPAHREHVLDELRLANCSGAERELIDELYAMAYHERLVNRDRVALYAHCEIAGARRQRSPRRVCLDLTDHARRTSHALEMDAVIFATGYEIGGNFELLDPLKPFLTLDRNKVPIRGADYRLVGDDRLKAGVYVHTLPDGRFGLSEGNITNLGPRSQIILASLTNCVPAADRAAQAVADGVAPPDDGVSEQSSDLKDVSHPCCADRP